MKRPFLTGIGTALALTMTTSFPAFGQSPLRDQLKTLPFKIAYESYVNDNWDIFVMNADGSHPVNITRTENDNELYPQVSPDGRSIAFVDDRGEGRDAIRSLWLMDVDGRHRKKIADYARQPFWSPDGKVIGFLPQEYPKFNVIDFFTKGMDFYNVATGTITPHVNATNLFHLYNPNFSPNSQWIVSTVHAGMGVGHAILLFQAQGDRILNLGIPGCRPRISPDGKQIAWGSGDHEIDVAPIDTTAETPVVGAWRLHIKDDTNKVYHVAWSPDSRFLCFSRGPDGEGDLTKPNTFEAACEIVGVYAKNWNICAVSAERNGTIDLNAATDADFAVLTTNGCSNKQPVWFRPTSRARD